MKSLIAFVCLTFVSTQVLSAGSEGKILGVRIQADFSRILIIQENAVYLEECEKKDFFYLPIDNDIAHNKMYSALLTAHSTGKNVYLSFSGCSISGRSAIKEVWLK